MFFHNEPIDIIHQPAAHTDGDSIVFFRRSDVVVAGDIYDTTSYPFIDLERGGSIQGEIGALNNLLELAIPGYQDEGGTYVIPGNGFISDRPDLLEYRDMVTIIRDRRHICRCDLQKSDSEEITMRGLRTIALAALVVLFPTAASYAQAGRGGAPPTPKAASPTDFTGYWVSVVTEDWLYRMVTPAKGDYSSVPLNPEGRKVADAWNPAKDEAEGNQCKAYGAPAIMRVPGRLHITWQDDNTLKIETDAGTQTRLLHFAPAAGASPAARPANEAPSWQGVSSARWESGLTPVGGGFGLGL